MKKKYVCLFIFSATTEEVEEKEKKSPRQNFAMKDPKLMKTKKNSPL